MTNKNNSINRYIDIIGSYYDKLPLIPKNVRMVIVDIIPYLALIFGILGIAFTFAAFGMLSFLNSFLFVMGARLETGFVAIVLGLLASILSVMSFSGLSKRQEKGWKLLYYSEVVTLLSAIVSHFSLGSILISLIAFYFLYQIRNYYK